MSSSTFRKAGLTTRAIDTGSLTKVQTYDTHYSVGTSRNENLGGNFIKISSSQNEVIVRIDTARLDKHSSIKKRNEFLKALRIKT